MYNANIVSMPDKWEYPWYAAWDLAFHVVALTLVDEDFGKQQLDLMLENTYIHPSGQLPAYEWNFGDVNPPVHAFSTIFTYKLEVAKRGQGDLDWLETQLPQAAPQLHVVGQPQGPDGQQCIRGRIPGPRQYRRLRPQRAAADWRVPGASRRHCMDGSSSARTCSRSPLSSRSSKPIYTDMCLKFVEHFLRIANALARGAARAWGCGTRRTGSSTTCSGCPTDARSGSRSARWSACFLCVRSPFSTGSSSSGIPKFGAQFQAFLEERPELRKFIHDPAKLGHAGRRLAAALDETKLRRVLANNARRE